MGFFDKLIKAVGGVAGGVAGSIFGGGIDSKLFDIDARLIREDAIRQGDEIESSLTSQGISGESVAAARKTPINLAEQQIKAGRQKLNQQQRGGIGLGFLGGIPSILDLFF